MKTRTLPHIIAGFGAAVLTVIIYSVADLADGLALMLWALGASVISAALSVGFERRRLRQLRSVRE